MTVYFLYTLLFSGIMVSFWKIVNKVISDADILLLLLDSRLIDETINKEIIEHVKKADKPLIYVMTKCDLVSKDIIEGYKKKFNPSVFVSAKEHFGTTILRDRILIEAKRIGLTKVRVGVLGYPNVGKSSLINSMAGRGAAPTSNVSGFTKGVQKVKSDNRILFLDTPGVIPYKEKDDVKHAFIGTIDFNKAKDPDLIVIELMEKFTGKIEAFYEVEVMENKEETIEEIAVKKNLVRKGNEPDIERVSRMILKDWQNGLIKQ